MSSKVPENAFELYVGLGPGRSYRALAEKLCVDKRTIVRHAGEEKWVERLAKIQEDARVSGDKRITETLEEMQERHLKMLRAMAGKSLQAMKEFPITSAAEGARIAGMVIKLERIVREEPAARPELSIEEITKREIETLLLRDGESEDWEPLEQKAAAAGGDLAPPPPPVEPPSPRPTLRPPTVPQPPVADPPWKSKREFTLEEILGDPDPE